MFSGGFCVYFGAHLVSWGSKKQPTVAHFSIKGEYKLIANTTCEVLWLQPLFRELGVTLPSSPLLLCDNIGATYLSQYHVLYARTKYIELDYHFIRERVASKSLQVAFCLVRIKLLIF